MLRLRSATILQQRAALHKTTNIIITSLLSLTTLLWLSSYTHHTAIGIDHDFEQQDTVLHKYYRINWTGYGSIWIGYGSVRKPNNAQPLEKFDLAAAFFHSQYKTPNLSTQTSWNRLGFWYINGEEPKPVFWIGIPSWLPVLILILLLFVSNRKPKGNSSLNKFNSRT